MNATLRIATRRFAPYAIAAVLFCMSIFPAHAEKPANIVHVFVATGTTQVAFFYVGQLGDWYRLMGTGLTTCFQRTQVRGYGVPATVDWSTGIATYNGNEVPGITLHLIYNSNGGIAGYTADVDTNVTTYEGDGSSQP